ncbi:MAG: FlgD immunoglobulin-like domain containing protein, partial [Candidatus Krumholzibacteriia bacterium]
LHPVYPNPTNPGAWIQFELPVSTPVRIAVFNANGRRMRTLAAGRRGPGMQRVFWDGRDDHGKDAPSGVYWIRMGAGSTEFVRKLILVR